MSASDGAASARIGCRGPMGGRHRDGPRPERGRPLQMPRGAARCNFLTGVLSRDELRELLGAGPSSAPESPDQRSKEWAATIIGYPITSEHIITMNSQAKIGQPGTQMISVLVEH
jgi:hypothetical protein